MINIPDATVADAVKGHWADRYLPLATRPYARLARLERPIGWWLLMWPCWWSAALVADSTGAHWPNLWHLLLLWLGAVAMRGAGCTWNDILDRDIDEKVARTRSRPLPSGQVSLKKAIIFLVLQGMAGLLILLQFNSFTVCLGIASLLVVAIYPAMKRITDYPQIVLGLAFSWGALVGWSATAGAVQWPALVLYFASVLWVVGYDTIYAHQDTEDDAMIGLGSTALSFGSRTRIWLVALYGLTVSGFGLAFFLAGVGLAAYIGLGAFALHLGWQVWRFEFENPPLALRLFKSNSQAGWLLFAGLVVDCLAKSAG